jgi:hypothetical protein
MINRLKTLFVPAFLAAGLAACGGGGGSISSAGDAFDTALSEGCAKAYECMDSYDDGGTGITFEQFYGTSEADCPAHLKMLIGYDAADVQASADAGRITFNADDANTCFDFETGLTCAQFWGTEQVDTPPECDTYITANTADGEDCGLDLDCSGDGSTCDDTTMTCGPG